MSTTPGDYARIQSPSMCHDHPRHHAGHCPECVALAVPRPDGFVVPRPAPMKVWHKPEQWPPNGVEHREIVRELADREATS